MQNPVGNVIIHTVSVKESRRPVGFSVVAKQEENSEGAKIPASAVQIKDNGESMRARLALRAWIFI